MQWFTYLGILWYKTCSSLIEIAKGSIRLRPPSETATVFNTKPCIYEDDKGQLRFLDEGCKIADGQLRVSAHKGGTYLIVDTAVVGLASSDLQSVVDH